MMRAQNTIIEQEKPVGQGRTMSQYDMERQFQIEQEKLTDNQLYLKNKLIA